MRLHPWGAGPGSALTGEQKTAILVAAVTAAAGALATGLVQLAGEELKRWRERRAERDGKGSA